MTSRKARHGDAPSVRAACARRGSRLRPEAAHHPQDERVVVEDVGQQDAAQRVTQVQRRARQPQRVHQQRVERRLRPQHRRERRRHDDGRQHEGHGRQRVEQALAGEVVAREDVRARQAQEQRQRGRKQGLPQREADHAQRRCAEDSRQQRVGRQPTVPRQAFAQNRAQWVEVEEDEEEEGRRNKT